MKGDPDKGNNHLTKTRNRRPTLPGHYSIGSWYLRMGKRSRSLSGRVRSIICRKMHDNTSDPDLKSSGGVMDIDKVFGRREARMSEIPYCYS